jgi:hypothetical protein
MGEVISGAIKPARSERASVSFAVVEKSLSLHRLNDAQSKQQNHSYRPEENKIPAAITQEKAMSSKKLVCIATGLSLLALPLFSAPALAKHTTRHAYPHRQVAARHYNPQRRAADGVLVDRNGWRQTASWDNSCHDLLYLHSMYACSGHGG